MPIRSVRGDDDDAWLEGCGGEVEEGREEAVMMETVDEVGET